MGNHTPGPWMPYEDAKSIGIYMRDDDGSCGPQVALVLTENLETDTCDQARADADLIAAAPDLLAACIAVVETDGYVGSAIMRKRIVAMKEAIAKAKGEHS